MGKHGGSFSPLEAPEMSYKEFVLVIPSIREINIDYLKYIPEDIEILVVDDSNGNIKPNRAHMQVFDYDFQRKVMGDDSYDLIPHKTAACRNFAFYYIWKETDFKLILTLDDDCKTEPGFMHSYHQLGQNRDLTTVTGHAWFNTIDQYGFHPPMFARGYPYWERFEKRWSITDTRARIVSIMGMWSRVLDVDGLDKYLFSDYEDVYQGVKLQYPLLRVGTRSAPTKFSFSAMNFGFIREVLPIMYQMPMVERFVDRYSIWRFDDIWAGYVLESLIHLKNDAICIGEPVIEHLKAGNLKKEVLGEHYGHLISPYFYRLIDAGASVLDSSSSYAEMYVNLFDHLVTALEEYKSEFSIPEVYCQYLRPTFERLLRWGMLFN